MGRLCRRQGCRFFVFDVEIGEIEQGNVDKEEQDNAGRIAHGASPDQIIQDVVGRAVAPLKEHVVVIKQLVGGKGRDAKAHEDGEGDPHILALHAVFPHHL